MVDSNKFDENQNKIPYYHRTYFLISRMFWRVSFSCNSTLWCFTYLLPFRNGILWSIIPWGNCHQIPLLVLVTFSKKLWHEIHRIMFSIFSRENSVYWYLRKYTITYQSTRMVWWKETSFSLLIFWRQTVVLGTCTGI